MHHGPRSLYILLTSFVSFDGMNNGAVWASYRDACEALGTRSRASIARWYEELEHYGFIVQTYAGCLGVEGYGESPHWRLTEWPTLDAKGRCADVRL
jgi:hypothetical protein